MRLRRGIPSPSSSSPWGMAWGASMNTTDNANAIQQQEEGERGQGSDRGAMCGGWHARRVCRGAQGGGGAL